LLPTAITLTKFLCSVSSNGIAAPRTLVATISATVLSLHCLTTLYDASILNVVLNICTAVFFSKGLLLCEVADDELLPAEQGISEVVRFAFMDVILPPHRNFLIRFRTIAFLLTVMLTVSVLALCRISVFDKTLTPDWWKYELTIVGIECGRWFLLCFIVLSLLL
jgi:hypothetical protein